MAIHPELATDNDLSPGVLLRAATNMHIPTDIRTTSSGVLSGAARIVRDRAVDILSEAWDAETDQQSSGWLARNHLRSGGEIGTVRRAPSGSGYDYVMIILGFQAGTNVEPDSDLGTLRGDIDLSITYVGEPQGRDPGRVAQLTLLGEGSTIDGFTAQGLGATLLTNGPTPAAVARHSNASNGSFNPGVYLGDSSVSARDADHMLAMLSDLGPVDPERTQASVLMQVTHVILPRLALREYQMRPKDGLANWLCLALGSVFQNKKVTVTEGK